ncbi:MAG: DnaB-like helicase C-terminal domain-containing protein [Pseudomonadota bacterium]
MTYADGHAHCFSAGCDYYEKAQDVPGTPKVAGRGGFSTAKLLTPDRTDAWEELKARRIKSETMRRYGYFKGTFRGEDGQPIGVQVAPYFDQQGNLAAQKLRFPPTVDAEGNTKKSFNVLKAKGAPGLSDCQLFGQQVYGDRFDRKVIVTEGELDALSVAQALDFKVAVVSLNVGAEAEKCIKANWRWLDRFEEIVLWFDDDDKGREAMEVVAKLFAVGKVRIAKAGNGAKDASDLLQANRPGDIAAAIYAAVKWAPAGIVNAADAWADFEEENELKAWSYPWPGLQTFTAGMREGEVTYHVAGTGIGKTTILCELVDHLLHHQDPNEPPIKIGVLAFESLRKDIQLSILSTHSSRRLDLEPVSKPDLKKLHTEVFGSRRVELFDAETAEWTIDAILSYVRYMASALDCKVIIIDPLSFIIAGLNIREDERRTLDGVSMSLARMAKELAVHLHIAHHLKRSDGIAHEEGGEISLNEIRGSGGIANFANAVVGWERNQQGDRPDLMRARMLKARKTGKTGVAEMLSYNDRTGRLHTTTDPWPDNSKSGRSKKGGFSQDYGNEY